MKLAYVTTYDAADVTQWSGLGFHIAEALRDSGATVDTIGPIKSALEPALKLKKAAYRYLLQRRFLIDRTPAMARSLAARAANRLGRSISDIVFSPGTIPIAYLECRQPIAFWTDATFGSMIDFYREYANLSAETIRDGHALERAAIGNCSLAIYSSHWAARSAVEQYGLDEAKVAVVPFGANFTSDIAESDVGSVIAARPSNRCELLFLGVDWYRKGGDVAYDVARQLNENGLETRLTIVGCEPTLPSESKDFVRILGRISKAQPEGRARLAAIIAASHFLILPTVADCTPVVFSEANAFAVPCLTSDVGGIASIVSEGVNGHVFAAGGDIEGYCARIDALMRDYEAYRNLARSAYAEYQSRLNWNVSGHKVVKLLQQITVS